MPVLPDGRLHVVGNTVASATIEVADATSKPRGTSVTSLINSYKHKGNCSTALQCQAFTMKYKKNL